MVDASVALKWFVPEVLSDRATLLLDGSEDLVAPDLLWPEVGNILWKKVGLGEVRPKEARDILASLHRTPLEVVPSGLLVDAALEIALATRLTVCDCVYVALAVARRAVLVTADDALVRVLSGGPLRAHLASLARWVPPS